MANRPKELLQDVSINGLPEQLREAHNAFVEYVHTHIHPRVELPAISLYFNHWFSRVGRDLCLNWYSDHGRVVIRRFYRMRYGEGENLVRELNLTRSRFALHESWTARSRPW
jgi:hypothetical protein